MLHSWKDNLDIGDVDRHRQGHTGDKPSTGRTLFSAASRRQNLPPARNLLPGGSQAGGPTRVTEKARGSRRLHGRWAASAHPPGSRQQCPVPIGPWRGSDPGRVGGNWGLEASTGSHRPVSRQLYGLGRDQGCPQQRPGSCTSHPRSGEGLDSGEGPAWTWEVMARRKEEPGEDGE